MQKTLLFFCFSNKNGLFLAWIPIWIHTFKIICFVFQTFSETFPKDLRQSWLTWKCFARILYPHSATAETAYKQETCAASHSNKNTLRTTSYWPRVPSWLTDSCPSSPSSASSPASFIWLWPFGWFMKTCLMWRKNTRRKRLSDSRFLFRPSEKNDKPSP